MVAHLLDIRPVDWIELVAAVQYRACFSKNIQKKNQNAEA